MTPSSFPRSGVSNKLRALQSLPPNTAELGVKETGLTAWAPYTFNTAAIWHPKFVAEFRLWASVSDGFGNAKIEDIYIFIQKVD